MSRLSYEVENVNGLIANFLANDRDVQVKILQVNRIIAQEAHDIAVQLCPKDTSYMSEHIRIRFSDEGYTWALGWEATDFVGVVNPVNGKVMIFYPPIVELGGFNSDPQPTLRPTMEAIEGDYKAALRQIMLAGYARAGI